jgi:hypothetical protein
MSDNLRRYRAICHALMHAYPTSLPDTFLSYYEMVV